MSLIERSVFSICVIYCTKNQVNECPRSTCPPRVEADEVSL